jgi:hypothetical protein
MKPPRSLAFLWRAMRRIVFIIACLVTFVTMFYVEENWRGRRAWENYQAELAAQGERLGPMDYAVASVPAEQNFAMTPVLRAITYRNRTDANLFAKFQSVRGVQDFWPMGTNAVRKEDVAQVLAAFQNVEAEMAELRAATKRPFAQFEKGNGNIFLEDAPNFIMLRMLGHLFTIHASAELAGGHADRAQADLAVVQRLADSLGGKVTLVEAMIRVAILGLTLPVFEEGLAAGAWSDEQLTVFQKSFESEELLAAFDAALRGGERNSITHLVAGLPRDQFMEVIAGNGPQDMKRYFFDLAVRWCPRGWLEQNAVNYGRVMQQQFDGYDVRAQRVFPEKCAAGVALAMDEAQSVSPFKYLVSVGVPNIGKALQTTAERQTHLREAALACALERYRRTRGEYPETLAPLVPQFIAKLPIDLMTGEALKYERTEKDKFRLYSVGWNLKDDGGVRTKDRATGDWVWPPLKQQ